MIHCRWRLQDIKPVPEAHDLQAFKGAGKWGNNVAEANDLFPHLRPQETLILLWKQNVSDLFRNILLPQQMFPGLRAEETLQATMFPEHYISKLAGALTLVQSWGFF